MSVYQSFNKRIGAWVKYEFTKEGKPKFFDVKERKPSIPFKGISKKGKRK